jgi:UDP-MurNAc hydroxylase
MQLTFLGHAGVLIDTAHGSILCDPWFNPAFFASWVPFPDNSGIDPEPLRRPDYLFISHSHDDHLDRRFLREHVDKDVPVILPDYPTADHRRALEDLGFHRFVETRNDEPVELDGLRILTNALVAPTDGAIGDAGLAVSDGTATVFNQNDSKPIDLDALLRFGPYDAHLVQFSGAIWYPMVYRLPDEEKHALGRRKRANQLARAARFVKEIGAAWFVPFAGPPCFLDEELFHLNDLGTEDWNIFLDQHAALEHMEGQGAGNGLLTVPGTVVEVEGDRATVRHPGPESEVLEPFVDKECYLRRYQARVLPTIAAEKATWPDHEVDLLAELVEWWEPLLATADHVAAGINGRVLLATDDEAIVVDFLDRRVKRWDGEVCRYRFFVPRPLLERCVERREVDWVNALFLSCRFEAERDGPYNEFVYNFFRSLSIERTEYTERYYSESAPPLELWEAGGYAIQRRCPHLKADLVRFGTVEDGILTCAMHGWQFELATGRCLTVDDRRLYCVPLEASDPPADPSP